MTYVPPIQRIQHGVLTGSNFVPNRWGNIIVQAESWNEANGIPMSTKQKRILNDINKYHKDHKGDSNG